MKHFKALELPFNIKEIAENIEITPFPLIVNKNGKYYPFLNRVAFISYTAVLCEK
jgi:hypothetical protein